MVSTREPAQLHKRTMPSSIEGLARRTLRKQAHSEDTADLRDKETDYSKARLNCHPWRWLLRRLARPGPLGAFLFFCYIVWMAPQTTHFLRSSWRRVDFLPRPVLVQTDDEARVAQQLVLKKDPKHVVTDRRNHYWLDHGAHKLDSRSKKREGCVPMADWQEDFHPACNMFHEIHLDSFSGHQSRLLNNGFFRDVWMIRDDLQKKRVLKTLRMRHDYDKWIFEKHRQDSVSMEQLSASPYILDIYGSCTNSAIVEYSDEGDLENLFEENPPSKGEVLKIAYTVATAVADAHHFDAKGRATIAHTDVKSNQFLNVNGTYKLNDFNRAQFLSWNPEDGKTCGFTFEKNNGKYRAPEEYKYEDESEKVDVFGLGGVMYFLLNKKHPWLDYESEDRADHIMAGDFPPIKKKIRKSKHPVDVALRKAMNMCWTYDQYKRPGAREVANMLKKALDDYSPKRRGKKQAN